MGFDDKVDAYDAGEVIRRYRYKETGLIGQKGETIDSIQYLLNVVVIEIALSSKDHRRYREATGRGESKPPGHAHRTARRVQRRGVL